MTLDDKFDALYTVVMKTAHLVEDTAKRVTNIERDIAELKSDVAELKAGQHRIEQRFQLMEERHAMDRTRITSVEAMHVQMDARLCRLEDALFPSSLPRKQA
jgi:septation ring formation regulator EzrA